MFGSNCLICDIRVFCLFVDVCGEGWINIVLFGVSLLDKFMVNSDIDILVGWVWLKDRLVLIICYCWLILLILV